MNSYEGITKRELWSGDGGKSEYAYFTDEMLEDCLAIREYNFYADGEAKTVLSLRYCDGDLVWEQELYWGHMLFPIQSYRIVKDIVEYFNRYVLDDFLEFVMKEFCRGGYSNKDSNQPVFVKKRITDEIQGFFKRIHQLKE